LLIVVERIQIKDIGIFHRSFAMFEHDADMCELASVHLKQALTADLSD
jgi:hypothetical protein